MTRCSAVMCRQPGFADKVWFPCCLTCKLLWPSPVVSSLSSCTSFSFIWFHTLLFLSFVTTSFLSFTPTFCSSTFLPSSPPPPHLRRPVQWGRWSGWIPGSGLVRRSGGGRLWLVKRVLHVPVWTDKSAGAAGGRGGWTHCLRKSKGCAGRGWGGWERGSGQRKTTSERRWKSGAEDCDCWPP